MHWIISDSDSTSNVVVDDDDEKRNVDDCVGKASATTLFVYYIKCELIQE